MPNYPSIWKTPTSLLAFIPTKTFWGPKSDVVLDQDDVSNCHFSITLDEMDRRAPSSRTEILP